MNLRPPAPETNALPLDQQAGFTSEIPDVTLLLNVNKAVGHDEISAYFLKVATTVIAQYLQCFLEFSFFNDIIPENCSLAKILPLHKKENKPQQLSTYFDTNLFLKNS